MIAAVAIHIVISSRFLPNGNKGEVVLNSKSKESYRPMCLCRAVEKASKP